MSDPTESIRRTMVAEINAELGSREYLEAKHGQVWDTTQMQQDFEVMGFMAPLIVVRRSPMASVELDVPTFATLLLRFPSGLVNTRSTKRRAPTWIVGALCVLWSPT